MLKCCNVAMLQICKFVKVLCCNGAMLQICNIAMLQCCKITMLQSCKVAMLQCCNVANLKSCKVATWLQTDVRTYGWTGVLLELLLELKNILTLSWKSIYYVETQPASLVRRTFKEMIVNPHKHSRAHRALV